MPVLESVDIRPPAGPVEARQQPLCTGSGAAGDVGEDAAGRIGAARWPIGAGYAVRVCGACSSSGAGCRGTDRQARQAFVTAQAAPDTTAPSVAGGLPSAGDAGDRHTAREARPPAQP